MELEDGSIRLRMRSRTRLRTRSHSQPSAPPRKLDVDFLPASLNAIILRNCHWHLVLRLPFSGDWWVISCPSCKRILLEDTIIHGKLEPSRLTHIEFALWESIRSREVLESEL